MSLSQVDLSSTAISAFLRSLPRSVLSSAAPTHLPTALPLSFPTPLHQLNVLATAHLIFTVLTQPAHAAYFAHELQLSPKDIALRGCLGLYLASETDWDHDNLLSTECWKRGELGEAKICEFFGIKVMREKAHETMPGITVGERWEIGSGLVADLVNTLKRVGESLKARCLGEEVQRILMKLGQEGSPLDMAKSFCEAASTLEPSMADSSWQPSGTILPAAPFRLLQDLSYLANPSSSFADLSIPSLDQLADLSPLPLPIPLLLYLGIYDLSDCSVVGTEQLRQDVGNWWKNEVDLFAVAQKTNGASGHLKSSIKVVEIPLDTYRILARGSIEACREIWSHSKSLPAVDVDEGENEQGWKRKISMAEITRIFEYLEEVMVQEGMGVRLVPV